MPFLTYTLQENVTMCDVLLKFQGHEGRINALQSNIGGVKTKVNTLKAQVDGIETGMDVLDQRAHHLQGEVTSLHALHERSLRQLTDITQMQTDTMTTQMRELTTQIKELEKSHSGILKQILRKLGL